MIWKGVFEEKVVFPSTNPPTVLKRMIATASLTMPSPKIKENSLGCYSYLTMDIAAITSDEHRRELTSMHSSAVNSN